MSEAWDGGEEDVDEDDEDGDVTVVDASNTNNRSNLFHAAVDSAS